MPKRIPEVDEKGYTDEALRRISLKHKAKYGRLPYPDPVPVPPLKKRNPSTADLLWANRFNMARHFIIGGSGAALATFTTTKDVAASGAAFIVGGIVGVTRKGFDDLRRVNGKPDGLSTIRDMVTHRTLTEGAEVNPILTMLLGSLDSVMVMLKKTMATSAEADKYVKAVCWNVLYFEPELREMAAKTETPYDDVFVTELVEAATAIWSDA